MASALGSDILRVVGGLHAVWCLFDEYSDDGRVDGYTVEAVDCLVGWPGFCRAMAGVGWLDIGGEFCAVPRFEEHNGQSAKRRAMEAERKRRERAEESGQASASYADKKRPREEIEKIVTSPVGEVGKPDEPGVAGSCPQQKIIDAYHEALPSGRKVRDWTPARAAALRARWRENPKRQSLDWWRRFFAFVAESAFLTGQVATPGRKPFEMSLDWLLKSGNFVKVLEGAYHDAGRNEVSHA